MPKAYLTRSLAGFITSASSLPDFDEA